MAQAASEDPWWEDCVVYQIYPRSFSDADGDGLGDLAGIIGRLDAIADLGVGAIWLSPIYPSPDADNGYDISDYCDVDPRYGTLADFDRLVAAARDRGLRIIMDLVINHTSDEHAWFQASRRREDPYTDFYLWRPPNPEGGPPNNWTGFFQGSTWTFDELRGEYYLHLFDRKQPDLNYDSPAVLERVKEVMRFWLDRGVSGFRCDVINILHKASLADGRPRLIVRGREHYVSTERLHAILRELRRDVLDPAGAFAIGESVFTDLPMAQELSDAGRRELHALITFEHLEVDRLFHRYVSYPFSARRLLARLAHDQQGLDWPAPYLESHDQPRIVSHYGDDGRYWRRSAIMLGVLAMTLRGTPLVYQGQEIGMTNFDFTGLDEVDDVETRNVDALMRRLKIPARLRWHWLAEGSRDNARTPVQWSAEPGAGFTTGRPWLPINANHRRINRAAQEHDPDSVLAWYRRLIALRSASATLRRGAFEPVGATRACVAYRRVAAPGDSADGDYTVLLNFTAQRRRIPCSWITDVAAPVGLSTVGRPHAAVAALEPFEALVLRQRSSA